MQVKMEAVKEFKTHIGKIRASHHDQREEVCSLLNLTDLQYCWHQYRQYERFVSKACAGYPQYKNMIRLSPIFRGFWNNEWAQRNEVEFLPYAYECKFDEQYILEEYKFIHSADRLFNEEAFYDRFENIIKLLK